MVAWLPVWGWCEGSIREFPATHTDVPPVIDGVLNEPAWQTAPAQGDFTSFQTESLANEQTWLRVLYDREAIYISFECLEPHPEAIVAAERKYDKPLWNEDYVEVRLDTFHDRRNAYVFVVNTVGTRYDARDGLYGFDSSWDCQWEAAATVGEDRWFVEMRIPMTGLLYEPGVDMTWGVNFMRSERSIPCRSWWTYLNSEAASPRQYGLMTGLDLSEVFLDRHPQVETYLSSTSDLRQSSTQLSTGADVTLRLNENMTSAFTLNPDYGQVEADPDTIELRDTERFLEEKRPFFREGSELFDTPLNVYYTRRFSEIDVGAKVTGQGQDWSMGLVDVYGRINREGKLVTGNYHVGRVMRYFGDDSQVGGIWTLSHRTDGTHVTGGMDVSHYLSSTTRFSAQVLGLHDANAIETEDQEDNNAYAAQATLSGGSKPLWWGVRLKDISRGFRPDLGYIPRRNIRGGDVWGNTRWDFEDGALSWVRFNADASLYENDDHQTTLRDFSERLGLCWEEVWEVWLSRSDNYHRPYKNTSNSVRLEYYEEIDYWRSWEIGFAEGTYEEEPYQEYWLGKPYQLTDRLTTEFRGNLREMDRVEGDEEIWLARLVTTYHFPWGSRLKVTAEQTSEDRHNLTNLFSWPLDRKTDLYVLYNDYRSGEERIRELFCKAVYRFY